MAKLVGFWGGGEVWCVTSGKFSSNAYICKTDSRGECILIDAGLDSTAIDKELNELGVHPSKVFCTHGHFDHAGSASFFQKKYGCKVYMHKEDAKILKSSNFLLMILKIEQKIDLPDVTYVDDGFRLEINGHSLTYMQTPGHTPGSCVIDFGSAWFTGDTLYSSGVGLSSIPGEDIEKLKTSIHKIWNGLTSERTVYPGHGNAENAAILRKTNYALLDFLGIENNDK